MDLPDISKYNYELPPDRIARHPLKQRDRSKLLTYSGGRIGHTLFRDLPEVVPANRLMVFNNTRVVQARFLFHKDSGAGIEVFCLEPFDPPDYESALAATGTAVWKCMVGNAGKWKENMLSMTAVGTGNLKLNAARQGKKDGTFLVRFSWDPAELPFGRVLDAAGRTPIPPYLEREAEPSDRERYQTVYSRIEGSVAAPTAGLHFTRALMDRMRRKGHETLDTTLHVSAGTFRPVRNNDLAAHEMHSEHMYFTKGTVTALKHRRDRILAVGTTSVRTIETIYWLGVKVLASPGKFSACMGLDQWEAFDLPQNVPVEKSLEALIAAMDTEGLEIMEAVTKLIIFPGYRFRLTGSLLTNFHMPRSTLLLLIAAFTGKDWRRIYEYALDNEFRFLSYGDSSYLEPGG